MGVYICDGELTHGLSLCSFQSDHDHSLRSYVEGVLKICYNSSEVSGLYHLNWNFRSHHFPLPTIITVDVSKLKAITSTNIPNSKTTSNPSIEWGIHDVRYDPTFIAMYYSIQVTIANAVTFKNISFFCTINNINCKCICIVIFTTWIK